MAWLTRWWFRRKKTERVGTRRAEAGQVYGLVSAGS